MKVSIIIRALGLSFIVALVIMLVLTALKANIYDSKTGINVLMISKKGIGIVGIRQDSGYLNVLILPEDLVIPITSSDSEFQIETLRKTGLSEKNRLDIMRQSIGQALGVVIPAVVFIDREISGAGLLESIQDIRTETNISLLDRLSLRSDLIDLLQKGASFQLTIPKNVYDVTEEPDGRMVKKLNIAVFSWSRNQWTQDEIMSETAEIGVVNGSEKKGRARAIARQIETAGGRVVEVKGGESLVSGCLIIGSKEEHPKTYNFLKTVFSCQETKNTQSDISSNQVSADIVIVLGGD